MISQKPSEVEANHQIARSRTARLEQDLMAVLSILRSSLRNPPLRWEDLTQETSFDIPQPQKPDDPEKLLKPPYPHPPDPAAFVLSEPTPIQPILTVNTENTTPVEGSALAG
jgi:hypothetical protein